MFVDEFLFLFIYHLDYLVWFACSLVYLLRIDGDVNIQYIQKITPFLLGILLVPLLLCILWFSREKWIVKVISQIILKFVQILRCSIISLTPVDMIDSIKPNIFQFNFSFLFEESLFYHYDEFIQGNMVMDI